MTVAEMHNAIQLQLDKSDSYQIAAFESEEFDYWLNEAQLELIKQKMFGNNPRGENYDVGTKRADDLSVLMEYSPELLYDAGTGPGTGPLKNHAYHPNVVYADIAANISNYLFYIGSDFLVDDPNASNPNVRPMETVLIEQKDIGSLVETPYNKPFLKNGYVYLKEGEVNVIYDPYATPYSIFISYLRKPLDLVLGGSDCELPEQVHTEIVALAVNLMLNNIADQREQANYIQLTKKE